MGKKAGRILTALTNPEYRFLFWKIEIYGTFWIWPVKLRGL